MLRADDVLSSRVTFFYFGENFVLVLRGRQLVHTLVLKDRYERIEKYAPERPTQMPHLFVSLRLDQWQVRQPQIVQNRAVVYCVSSGGAD